MEKIKICQGFKAKNLINGEQKNEKFNKSQNLSELNTPTFDEFLSPKIKEKEFFTTQATTFKKNDCKVFIELKKHKEIEVLDSRNQTNLEISPLKNRSETVKSYSFLQKNQKFTEKLKKIFSNSKLTKFLFQPKNPIVFLQRYEILHLYYKSERSIHKYYVFLLLMRQSCLSVLAVVFCYHPFIQIISINVVNLSFVGYSIFSKPFTNFYVFLVCVIDELITEIAFISAFVIALYDYLEIEDYESRMNLGWAIVMVNLILLYWVLGTGLLRPLVFAIIEFRKKRNELRKIHCTSNK